MIQDQEITKVYGCNTLFELIAYLQCRVADLDNPFLEWNKEENQSQVYDIVFFQLPKYMVLEEE